MKIKTIASVFALAALSLPLFAADKPKVSTLAINADAPDFSLEGTDGKVYTLNSFKDAKILVVVFTCNHCPDATAARDKINQFAIDYKSKGVEVVAISSASPQGVQVWENMFSKYDDDFESMKLVAKDHALVHPYLYGGKPPQ